MASSFQLVIDCADPEPLARFWAAARYRCQRRPLVAIETRRQRVDAEAGRLTGLGAVTVGVLHTDGLDHYGVAMIDPEGSEFDIN